MDNIGCDVGTALGRSEVVAVLNMRKLIVSATQSIDVAFPRDYDSMIALFHRIDVKKHGQPLHSVSII